MSARLALLVAAVAACGCSLGQGEGQVISEAFYAPGCWGTASKKQPYNLRPDFFAANPDYSGTDPNSKPTMFITVQRGNDQEEYSDGLSILLDDVPTLRSPAHKGRAEPVGLQSGIGAQAGRPPEPATSPLLNEPPLVHMSLYLQQSCHNQGTILNAVSGTITFHSLFSGDPNEQVGSEKYTDATFDVQVGDLQEVPEGQPADAVPANLQSHMTGFFRFYFERGQPAQPFP
ncbi:MAG TPA: hypothetical protein VHB21_07375 [Minicystis sp.]|nr:hypothetical protein [Minicystis sp.]